MCKVIPNILTFARLVLTGFFLGMLVYSPAIAVVRRTFFLDISFVIFLVAGLTDMIDGAFARRLGAASRFGRMLDPLVDKVLVCGSFICFALIGEPRFFGFSAAILSVIHWSVAAVIIVREFYVTVLRHIAESRGISFAATFSGKVKMFLQSFAIGTVIVRMSHFEGVTWGYWFTAVVFVIMLAVTVVSGIRATRRSCWIQATR